MLQLTTFPAFELLMVGSRDVVERQYIWMVEDGTEFGFQASRKRDNWVTVPRKGEERGNFNLNVLKHVCT